MPLIVFACLFALSSTVINSSRESGHSCLVLGVMPLIFFPLIQMMSFRAEVYIYFILRKVSIFLNVLPGIGVEFCQSLSEYVFLSICEEDHDFFPLIY